MDVDGIVVFWAEVGGLSFFVFESRAVGFSAFGSFKIILDTVYVALKGGAGFVTV